MQKKRLFKFVLVILFSLMLLTSCVQAVCRHHVLEGVAVATELNREHRIVVYDVYDLNYSHHAQVQVKENGEWRWLTSFYGYYYVSDRPELKIKSQIIPFNMAEYMEFLKKGTTARKSPDENRRVGSTN